MKWIKALLIVVAVAMVTAVVLSAGGYYMFRGVPSWYKPSRLSAAEKAAAARKTEDTLARMHNWANRGVQTGTFGSSPTTMAEAMGQPADQPFELSFTDDELNAFFDKWSNYQNRRESIDHYVSEPRLVIQDGKVILAGTLKEMGTVVSLDLLPEINQQGDLLLKLDTVRGGILPLPDAIWSRQRHKVEKMLLRELPHLQSAASIRADGTANPAAASVSMDELLLGILRGQSVAPVLFIPYDINDLRHSVPVKISAVSVEGNTLKLTAVQLSPVDRQNLLQRLRGYDPAGNAMTDAH